MMKRIRLLLRISWRNVFRNKRRTILSLLILVLGCTGLILVGGFFDSLLVQLKEAYIFSYSGNLQVSVKDYFEKGASAPFDYLMSGVPQLQQEIESEPHVLYTVPRLIFNGILNSDNSSIAVMALGIDPLRERRMTSRTYLYDQKATIMKILEGEDLDPQDPYGVLLGPGVMKALGLKIGDRITFLTMRKGGSIDGAEFHVRGVLQTSIKEVGDRAMKVNLETAQRLLATPGEVHTLLVLLDSVPRTALLKERLERKFLLRAQKLEVIPWEQQADIYWQSEAFLSKVQKTIQVIIAIVFFFSVANTVNMMLFERMREYGTMMAIGNSRWTIFGVIAFESLFLGVLGAILGVLVGMGVAQIISLTGIMIPSPPPASGDIKISVMILISPPKLILESFLISVGAAALASLIPSYRASHFRIVQALGYV